MAVSIRLALLSLGTTILLCFLFTAVASADHGDDIHAVNHASAGCHGEHSDKGDQCREGPDDVDDDDDFDDTYKIVNNIAVKLSSSGNVFHWVEKAENNPSEEEELGNFGH